MSKPTAKPRSMCCRENRAPDKSHRGGWREQEKGRRRERHTHTSKEEYRENLIKKREGNRVIRKER